MSLEKYRGRIDHIASVVGAAGFDGLEAEMVMLGGFAGPSRLAGALDAGGLQLAALTLVEDWAGDEESPEEYEEAEAAIALTAKFKGTLLVLCQMPGRDREDLRGRQDRVLRCLRGVAARATDAGLVCAFHPNSPAGSVFRDADDYDRLLERLPETVGFAPDLGHIAQGRYGCSCRHRPVLRPHPPRARQGHGRAGQMGLDRRRRGSRGGSNGAVVRQRL